jgi:serine/threonine-protein kinase
MLGRVVDERYELVRLLGTGGMGNVYEAVHRGTGRHVALKVIANAELANDSGAIARFQREAKAAGSVETPHIAQVLDAGTDRVTGAPYIAMEFLVGDDLRALSDQLGPLDPHLGLRIVAQACSGLQKAHELGIVHRDIKPANLFLAHQPDGRVVVKVLDFGIAKLPSKLLQGADALSATTTGRLLGSPLFMSPEQIRGLKTLDHRTDIWSIGAVLYQALAGRPPFAECETVGQLMVAICSQPPPLLGEVAPWLRADAVAIVDRALRSNPDERYATAGEMLSAILALLPSGIEINADALVSASGRKMAAPRPGEAPVRSGTESLEDNERFLVEPPSSRKQSARVSKPRAKIPENSDSTMPSADSGPKPKRMRRSVALFIGLSGGALAAAFWAALRSDAPPTLPVTEPARPSAAPEVRASTALDMAPPHEPPAPVAPSPAQPDTGSVEPHPRATVSSKERKNRPGDVANVAPSPAPPSPAPVAAPIESAPVVAAAAAVPAAPPAPAAAAPVTSASAQPPSRWSLDRDFPSKKGSP